MAEKLTPLETKKRIIASLIRSQDDLPPDFFSYLDHEDGWEFNHEKGYSISPVNEKNKKSRGFMHCTGVFASGYDQKLGKNVSFISHQNPEDFLVGKKVNDEFRAAFTSRLKELFSRCSIESIDIVFLGGSAEPDGSPLDFYVDSIEAVNALLQESGYLNADVISGPTSPYLAQHAYMESGTRHLFLLRNQKYPDENLFLHSFPAKDVNQQIKKLKDLLSR